MNKRGLLFLALLSAGIGVNAQQKAVTETGEEVILFDNGTWKSAAIKPAYDTRLDTLKKQKSRNASFLVKSTKVPVGVWVDPDKWAFRRRDGDNEVMEYSFTLKHEDAYAMLISERIGIPYSNLREIALEKAKEAAADATLTREETRIVNGKLMHMLEISGTISGIKFAYIGYYYSDDNATIQFVAYTSRTLVDKYRPDIEELLNGFVVLNGAKKD